MAADANGNMEASLGLLPTREAAGPSPSNKSPQLSPQQRAQYLQMAGILGNVSGVNPGATGRLPGTWLGGPDPGGGSHHDVARDVGQQVERMILLAKHDSENRVGQEIVRLKTKMEAISAKIRLVSERVSRIDQQPTGSIRKADLQMSIAKLEEVWEGEVGTLKHELWQTIQAHNHNADLMKHHKDAIDQMQARLAECIVASSEQDRVHEQLAAVDKSMQREQAKQQHIDQLAQRLAAVQQQLAAGLAGSGAGAGYSGGSAGTGGMGFHMSTATAPQAASGAAALKKASNTTKVPKKAAKAPKAAAVANGARAASLRAEAPEFVPTTWTTEGA